MVEPMHTSDGPSMGAGEELTANAYVLKQPVGSVYDMNTLPIDTPVTAPEELMVATHGALVLQLPVVLVSVKVVVNPMQTAGAPEIAPGGGLTVTVVVVRQPVGKV